MSWIKDSPWLMWIWAHKYWEDDGRSVSFEFKSRQLYAQVLVILIRYMASGQVENGPVKASPLPSNHQVWKDFLKSRRKGNRLLPPCLLFTWWCCWAKNCMSECQNKVGEFLLWLWNDFEHRPLRKAYCSLKCSGEQNFINLKELLSATWKAKEKRKCGKSAAPERA